ncbi:zinc finger protein 343-like [Seriola dumerili]|uniref:zinc finger protein 343-like n=1 Tax=Seriola dumerili TaxID=41447 RepID=UPI000BBF3A25|nr:zinc finger protein 343-like [Seriola dumerili]XP_022616306.1 zinc finger protein 343-like [Seriola dumerili]XP_022616307.1 zinc finger protein 343-like [Seriola dumerili]XP_022616308.1 zinc finger protein 343-like [Seriola dumerili]XP_022616309.1 zinc finger protein 343-like [Seriola dumerili]
MPSLIMEGGQQKLQNVLEDGLSTELINAGRFCFSCEQIFSDRRSLEEHVCSAASYICSCGTEFTQYSDMLEHSTTHEPGHQVLDHETIKKRRIEKRIEEEEKLKRLQTGEVVWKAPKMNNVASISMPVNLMLQRPITSGPLPVPIQSSKISQVPELYPAVSQASFLSNPATSTTDMQNIFAGVGAPTVDLWTLYQPVVVINTVRKFNKKKPYTCGKCGQCFVTKTSLISHHSSHVTDKVSGCIGCGLLLSSKKVVPRFHVCNSPNTATKFRLITAKPLNFGKPNKASTHRSQNPSAQEPQVPSSIQLKRQNPSVTSKGIQTSCVTSILQLKNQNIRSYSKSTQGFRVTPLLQTYSRNPSTSKPYTNVSLLSKNQSPNLSASTKSSGRGLSFIPSLQMKSPTNSASGVLSKPMQISSAKNGFTCRVCQIPFETAQLLQRHKCIKAQEFMAQQVRGGKQHFRLKRVTPLVSPVPVQMNGDIKLDVPLAGNIKKNQVVAVSLDRGQGADPVNGKPGVKMDDDDCYIVESGPDKPAEMIYQVTSSVPIIT